MLTVASPFIDEIGAEASDKTLAITDAPLLAGDLLASHAAPGVTVESLMASGHAADSHLRTADPALRHLCHGMGEPRRFGAFPQRRAWPRRKAGGASPARLSLLTYSR